MSAVLLLSSEILRFPFWKGVVMEDGGRPSSWYLSSLTLFSHGTVEGLVHIGVFTKS